MSASNDNMKPRTGKVEREYERSGCYPPNGRPFRIWALLGVLALTVALMAGVSALLNLLLMKGV